MISFLSKKIKSIKNKDVTKTIGNDDKKNMMNENKIKMKVRTFKRWVSR